MLDYHVTQLTILRENPAFSIRLYMLSPISSLSFLLIVPNYFFDQIGQVAEVLKTQGAQLILPVAFLHAAAFFLGYLVSKISFGESTSRTISIECGMQVCITFNI